MSTAVNQGAGLTLKELEEYQKQQGEADLQLAEQIGQYVSRYGSGYSTEAKDENSVKLAEPYDNKYTWYNPGTVRTYAAGNSGADETFLSDEDYQTVQELKQRWADATNAGNTEAAAVAHAAAEAIRARYDYSGDSNGRTDGGGYVPVNTGSQDRTPSNAGGGSSSSDSMRSLLEQWQQAAIDQSNGQIDYATQQAIAQLERAVEDAQGQYKGQAESVARDELQALDNAALYAEARGDKGGIGQSQYNEIQAAAAQNRLAVQQAQTKLATDTARQIEDLRAQGEFEKADAVLEITQTYLAQLLSLEQWAAEFGLSQQQFQASLQQWQAEYDMAMQEFHYTVSQNAKSDLAAIGEALLANGISLTPEQMEAMGMTESQMQQYLAQLQPETQVVYDKEPVTGGITEIGQLGAAARQVARVISDPIFSSPALAAAYIEEQLEKKSISPEEAGYLLTLVGY